MSYGWRWNGAFSAPVQMMADHDQFADHIPGRLTDLMAIGRRLHRRGPLKRLISPVREDELRCPSRHSHCRTVGIAGHRGRHD